jgi:hypothetical protein
MYPRRVAAEVGAAAAVWRLYWSTVLEAEVSAAANVAAMVTTWKRRLWKRRCCGDSAPGNPVSDDELYVSESAVKGTLSLDFSSINLTYRA